MPPAVANLPFRPDEAFARATDESDPLRGYRERFHLPRGRDGRPVIYFASHSLGLEPKSVRALLDEELNAWAERGVEGHFSGASPWYTVQERIRGPMAELVGARPDEVVLMNGLTVNLHLMMTTFYRPARERFRILVEEPTFPSDLYAIKSQLRLHGYDPADALVAIGPRHGEDAIRIEDIERLLAERGQTIRLVLLNAVNFLSGQWFDVPRIAEAARQQGCVVGLDLAHAVGNVPLALHDWSVDFAVWCTYKYVCGGPGGVAGCFVHERHAHDLSLPRLAGWWGNDPDTRFRMQLEPEFRPQAGADGWQVSNPPIFALAPVRAALEIVHEVGLAALRAKSVALTGYLEYLVDAESLAGVDLITPRDPAQRGAQLSLRVPSGGKELLQALAREGAIADYREPNLIRVAPVPLYNTFHEVWAFVQILGRLLRRTGL